ncbi:unnamed protein product [Anisakis simplex]|uniref:Uncharacterized protein n=1 Tax=Anisakis simplex TaxID=6269 RepID=A0A0M3K4L1_ANISI|nr:unnamed protein product [Anisakis simplex]
MEKIVQEEFNKKFVFSLLAFLVVFIASNVSAQFYSPCGSCGGYDYGYPYHGGNLYGRGFGIPYDSYYPPYYDDYGRYGYYPPHGGYYMLRSRQPMEDLQLMKSTDAVKSSC